MLTLGVDPDTKHSGFAKVDRFRVHLIAAPETRTAHAVRQALFEIDKAQASGFFRLVVEGQEIYTQGKANANNLISVAHIAGGALSYLPQSRVVLPKVWKGQQPKGVNQKATLDYFIAQGQGWEYRDNGRDKSPTVTKIPDDVKVIGEIPNAHWKEVLDAMGIALYGARLP